MDSAVSLKGISKHYRIYPSRSARMREIMSLGRTRKSQQFWALKDVDLEVQRGATLGLLGRNGAGKSTLLKIVSGVLQPTSGEVDVRGRLVALLQLGAGFNPEFTGRENVMMNGLILGIDRREMIRRFDDIAEFADIGDFMEQPVKTYSSGMRARLGFAVAVNVEPEILIVDEILSVGDTAFKQRSIQRMRDLRDSEGTTILFVSHSEGQIKNFCTEAALLHQGELIAHGGTSETVDRYQALLAGEDPSAARTAPSGVSAGGRVKDPDDPNDDPQAEDDGREQGGPPRFREDSSLDGLPAGLRRGTGEVRMSSVELIDGRGKKTQEITAGDTVTVRAHLEFAEDVRNSSLKVTLRNQDGLDVFTTSTALEKTPIRRRESGERVIVGFTFDATLKPGTYGVTAGISPPGSAGTFYDWIDVAASFKISKPANRPGIPGLVHLPTRVEIQSPQRETAAETGPYRREDPDGP